MPHVSLRHAFAIALLCATTALAAGCDCGDKEDDPVEACDKISAAVVSVGAGCRQTITRTSVCGDVCNDGGVGECTDHADVDACVRKIQEMSCSDTSTRAYEQLDACERIFRLMASSCDDVESESSGGFSDWDD